MFYFILKYIYASFLPSCLQLEENIRTIALSGEWIKLVDDLLVESSVIQGPTCTVGTTQRRAPYSRRSRKQSAIQEVIDDDCNDKSFVWWQGGKLSKIIFQRAILARSLVKKAARQGKFSSGIPSCKTSWDFPPFVIFVLDDLSISLF